MDALIDDTDAAARQFSGQAPYLPGTFWLVDGQAFLIDPAGREVDVNTGHRPQLCWKTCSHHHSVQQLFLTLEAVAQAAATAVPA